MIGQIKINLGFDSRECWIGSSWYTTDNNDGSTTIDLLICLIPMFVIQILWTRTTSVQVQCDD